MIIVSRSVHIDAPRERVFALMADPIARSRLNPHADVVRVDIEGGGPLHRGAVCRFLLKSGDQTLHYRVRVREFIPNELIVSEAEAAVPFSVRIETRSEAAGTRLIQTETFEPTEEILRTAMPEDESRSLMRIVYRVFMFMDADAALRLRQRQEEHLRKTLERRLDDWLGAIKRSLETGLQSEAR